MIERELFEAWMQRIMERLDRQDKIISVLINKDAAGVKYMDGERLYDNQDLCEMLRTSKRSLQRFRSEYGLRYRKISRKSYYTESDVLDFINRNMEEVVQGGVKILKMKENAEKKVPGQGKKKRQREMKTEKTAKACDSIIIKNIENGTEKEKRERRAGRPR